MADPILIVLGPDGPNHELPIPEAGVALGRSPDNDLVLADGGVSRHHCVFWIRDGQLWVRDRGSRNGTFVGGLRIEGAWPVQDEDPIRLGEDLHLRVTGAPAVADRNLERGMLLLEDEASGVRFPIRPDPSGAAEPISGLRVQVEAGGEDVVAEDGTAWQPGSVHTWDGRTLRLMRFSGLMPATTGQETDGLPVHIHSTLNGASGPEAWVAPLPDGERTLVGSGNRAVLIYVLSQTMLEQRASGAASQDAGWCADDELASKIWGRAWTSQDLNGLHVLLYRVRKAFEAAGVDSSVLEKRRKATRLRAQRLTVG